METKILLLIPARMGSSRIPGKPMAKINAKPMIQHVYENVQNNKLINYTAVATCDNEIFDFIKSIGGNAVMTSKRHERASDRCAEALNIIEDKLKIKYDIVVMVQGDEPMIKSEMISQSLKPMLNDSTVNITNLIGKIKNEKEFKDHNCIKVVCDLNGNALYFSRQPIPNIKTNNYQLGKQICVIPFRRNFLLKYNNMDQTPLEIEESIDMLRILENGLKVRMVDTEFQTYAVDTKADLIKVENILKKTIFEK